MRGVAGLLLGALLAALLAEPLRRLAVQGGFVRRNYRGVPVPVSLGWTLLLASAGAAAALWGAQAALPVAVWLAFAWLGLVDDAAGDRQEGGIGGHLRALAREGRLTTGALKLLGGVGMAAWLAVSAHRGVVAEALGAVVVAGSANLWNLLDVRPGRALKAAALAGVPVALVWPGPWAAAVGAACALLPWDLRAEGMLGDAGANPLGAAVGTALAMSAPVPLLYAVAAVLLAVHAAAERVSLSAWIARCPVTRLLDELGQR